MSISFFEILEDEIFDGAEVVAGHDGLRRDIRRVSVFDCPYHEDMMAEGVIQEGDLFLSCLEQFPSGTDGIIQFFEGMIKYKAAGLMIVPTGRTYLSNLFNVESLCKMTEIYILAIEKLME